MPAQVSIKMVKVLSFSFEQYFSPFTMLLVEKSSETGLFRYLSNHVFRSLNFKNTSAMSLFLFLRMFKTESKFTKSKKNSENVFCFWHNCIWECCYKLSLLRTEYLLSGVNRLTNSPMILHMTKRNFFNWIFLWFSFTEINKYGKGAVLQLGTLFQPVYHVTCQRVLWNVTF